jgi:hypothetical protein
MHRKYKYKIYRSNPQQAASAVGASNKSPHVRRQLGVHGRFTKVGPTTCRSTKLRRKVRRSPTKSSSSSMCVADDVASCACGAAETYHAPTTRATTTWGQYRPTGSSNHSTNQRLTSTAPARSRCISISVELSFRTAMSDVTLGADIIPLSAHIANHEQTQVISTQSHQRRTPEVDHRDRRVESQRLGDNHRQYGYLANICLPVCNRNELMCGHADDYHTMQVQRFLRIVHFQCPRNRHRAFSYENAI